MAPPTTPTGGRCPPSPVGPSIATADPSPTSTDRTATSVSRPPDHGGEGDGIDMVRSPGRVAAARPGTVPAGGRQPAGDVAPDRPRHRLVAPDVRPSWASTAWPVTEPTTRSPSGGSGTAGGSWHAGGTAARTTASAGPDRWSAPAPGGPRPHPGGRPPRPPPSRPLVRPAARPRRSPPPTGRRARRPPRRTPRPWR